MNLYLLKKDINNNYDTYDSCIVCAESEEEALKYHPNGRLLKDSYDFVTKSNESWVYDISNIIVTEIGTANNRTTKGVVLASFNAE